MPSWETPYHWCRRAAAGPAAAFPLPDVHSLLGAIHLYRGDHDAAVAAADRAVALAPNHATNMALRGMILMNAGRHDEAIRDLRKAMRLSPYYPPWFLSELASAYAQAGRHEEAVAAFNGAIERAPSPEMGAIMRILRALSLLAIGREDEARADVTRALADNPGLSATTMRKLSLGVNPAPFEKALVGLRRLGLPD